VNSLWRFAVVAILISGSVLPVAARKKAHHAPTPGKTDTEAATRLQVFLDRANFSPGKIDGRYNEVTSKALALYRQSRGEQTPPPQKGGHSNAAPNLAGVDVASVNPVFISYTVIEADLQSIGPSPGKPAEQAKLKFLPYHDAADAIAEKFHSDIHLLEQLNPGKLKTVKPGDQLMVPNVEPFELASVKDIKPGSETTSRAANDIEDQAEEPGSSPGEAPGARRQVAVKIDTKTNMLGVFDGEKLVAAYPVTVGSAQTASPIGEWKVRNITPMPTYRKSVV